MVTAQVRAIWSSSYNSNPVDLLFEAGDTIDVIYPYDGGWWFWGHISGHVGLFPFNFVVCALRRLVFAFIDNPFLLGINPGSR